MTSSDKQKFATLMMALAEVFDSGKEPSPAKVEIYFRALEGHPVDVIEGAVSELISTRSFASFPKPAEILEVISGDTESRAVLAWGKVDKAIRCIGHNESVMFDDPVIHAVIDFLGGWIKICETSEADMVWRRKEFERLYEIMFKRGIKAPKHLVGLVEATNRTRYPDHVPEPVRIGFEGRKQIEGEEEL